MDLELAAKKLRTAQRAITAALEAIDAVTEQSGVVSDCSFCGEPILEGEATRRDVHSRCYLVALKMVNDGKTTWEKLESEGLVAPPGKSGRKPSNPRLEAIYAQLDAKSAELDAKKKPPKK